MGTFADPHTGMSYERRLIIEKKELVTGDPKHMTMTLASGTSDRMLAIAHVMIELEYEEHYKLGSIISLKLEATPTPDEPVASEDPVEEA